METLLLILSVIFGGIGIALIIWILRYTFSKSINGKNHIEQYMSDKYGDDWLEQCMEGLRDPNIRKSIADELKLKN